MKRENFERIKEEEKAHLREIRKLKGRLREAERIRSIGKALSDVESAGSMDELDAAVREVQLQALQGESKLDVLLESSTVGDRGQKSDPAELETELSKAKAAELVRHMKMSMGLEERETTASESSESVKVETSVGKSVGRDENPTEKNAAKTIGRMKGGDG